MKESIYLDSPCEALLIRPYKYERINYNSVNASFFIAGRICFIHFAKMKKDVSLSNVEGACGKNKV